MTPPRITIEVELSREGLLELRFALDALLRDLGGDSSEPDRGDLVLQADRKVGEVWGRVGDNIKRFLTLGAQLNNTDDAEFSMNDVADGLETSVKTVRSWHRNLGRTLRQVDEAIPEPPFMIGRWDGERQQYRFPPEIRAAILDRHARSGRLADVALDTELRDIERKVNLVPVVAVREAVDLLERELGRRLATRNVELLDDNPDMYDKIKAACRTGLMTAKTGTAWTYLAKQRDRTRGDASGTHTTPDQARDVLMRVRALLTRAGAEEADSH
jgi:hypothetical protein